jgi:hypothetical protein
MVYVGAELRSDRCSIALNSEGSNKAANIICTDPYEQWGVSVQVPGISVLVM